MKKKAASLLQQRKKENLARVERGEVKEAHVSQKNRLWFPLAEDKLEGLKIITTVDLFDFGPKEDGPVNEWIFASKADDICKLFPHPGITYNPEDFLMRLADSHSINPGFIIPTAMLDRDSWLLGDYSDEAMITFTLTVKLALTVSNIGRAPQGTHDTIGPLRSLELGCGNCFQLSSLLAAALRINGIPSRVVGNPHFFGVKEDGGDHWWVEAYAKDHWMRTDPSIPRGMIDYIRNNMQIEGSQIRVGFQEEGENHRKIPDEEFLPILTNILLTAPIPISATTNPRFSKETGEAVIAAEVDYSEYSRR